MAALGAAEITATATILLDRGQTWGSVGAFCVLVSIAIFIWFWEV